MKVTTAISALFVSWVVPPRIFFPNDWHPGGRIHALILVEGLDAARVSLRRPLGNRMTKIPGMIVPPAQPSSRQQTRCQVWEKASPRFPAFQTVTTELDDWRRHPTLLWGKNTGNEEDKNTDGNEPNDDIGNDTSANNNNPVDLVVAADEATITTGRRQALISDFLYGANYVHSQYLSILWRYSILRSFAVTLPIFGVLWLNQAYGAHDALFRVLRSVLAVSSVAARLLQLPLEFAQSLVLGIWNTSPEALAAAINFLPNAAAIPLVQLLLLLRASVTSVVEVCSGNRVVTFLSSMVAILVWRPAVEEWQYRSVLDKLLFGAPRFILSRGGDISSSTVATIQRMASVRSNLTGTVDTANNETILSSEPSSSSVEMAGNLSISNQNVDADAEHDNSTSPAQASENGDDRYTPFLPDKSTRILLGSLLFATTRLGWLSSDPAHTVALSKSPYGFTIGFLQSIWSMTETQDGLRIFVLLLAVHQTVSTFLVAQHVFAGIYRQRGLAASVGAHISWTVGKGTILFRLAWKFWQATLGSVWNLAYGLGGGVESDPVPVDTK